MILAIFLAFSEFTTFGRKLEIPKKRTRQLSSEPSWYFIHLHDDFNINDHNETFDITTFISKNWHRAFLTPSKRVELEQTGLVEMREITSEEKIIESDIPMETAECLIVEADSTFSPVDSETKKWTKLSDNIYHVNCTNNQEVAEQLSQIKQVVTIRPSSDIKLNNRFATGRLQGSIQPTTESGIYQTRKPFLNEGINGEGEIITIIDSGLDMKSTYFYDSEHPNFQFNKIQTEQRKVILYNTESGDNRDDSGHGTHVAGTASGKSSCQNCNAELYDGMAPNSKIVFYDGGVGKKNGIRIPYMKNVLDQMLRVKSNILSCSWGSYGENILETSVYDKLMYQYPDIIAVFAAGNDGIKVIKNQVYINLYSIGSPGASKNVFTVGNMLSPYSMSFETDETAEKMRGGDATFEINNYYQVYVSKWSNNSMRIGLNPKIKGQLVGPQDSSSDRIVYIRSNHCYELSRLLKKPKAVVFGRYYQRTCNDYDFPVFYTNSDISNLLETMITISPKVLDGVPEQMTKSSSRGPTPSGLLKPDISGVGALIMSAESTMYPRTIPHNNLIGMTGTSMATPLISGTLALIDQYFRNKNIKPDASLLKALMISSADPILSYSRTPDAHSGHGIPNIKYILRDTTNVAQKVSIKNHQHLVAKISVVSTSEPLRIGMSYLDYPANPESTFFNLIADLNLYVKDPNGKIIYGNMHQGNIEEHFSTNEKVVIESQNLIIGEYEIHVINEQTAQLPYGETIKFSACAVGQIMEGSLIFNEARTCGTCSNHGTCDRDNVCKCRDGYVGVNCQIEEINLNSRDARVDMAPSGLAYFNLTLPRYYSKVDISLRKQTGNYQESFKLFYSANTPRRTIGSNDGVLLMNRPDFMSLNAQILPKDFPGGTTLHFIALNNYPDRNVLSVQTRINTQRYMFNSSSAKSALQSWKTIGIIFSCVAVVAIVVGIFTFFIKRSKSSSNDDVSESGDNNQL